MTPEQWDHINEIVERALDLPKAERSAFLDSACGGDGELRREVERMLATEEPADRIGPYAIEAEIGRGPMGVVYRAARDFEGRRVEYALKVVDPLNADEIGNLASLDHPHIARLHDHGMTALGEPYLVMEYVDGKPIVEYCEGNGLSVRERVALALRVAEALVYVHQQLVVHRDLKPSNILVNGKGEPKVLDFGISRILRQEAARTAFRGWTPQYASPEQARGEGVLPSSDIYSFGMVLCEMLCGQPPYRVPGRSEREMVEFIAQVEPEEPSRLATGRVRRQLQGELDSIVRKALEKKPADRYASMAALATDLRAWLSGEVVAAHDTSRLYRWGKLVRKYPAGIAVTTALATGLVFAGVQAGRIMASESGLAPSRFEAAETGDFLALLGAFEHVVHAENANLESTRALLAALDGLRSVPLERLDADSQLRLGADLFALAELNRSIATPGSVIVVEGFRRVRLPSSAGQSFLDAAEKAARQPLPDSVYAKVPIMVLAYVRLLPDAYRGRLRGAHELLGDVHYAKAMLPRDARRVSCGTEAKAAGAEYQWAARLSWTGTEQTGAHAKLLKAEALAQSKTCR